MRSEAQQIVQEQQHVAAVNTMTDLLLEQQAAESTATAAIVTSQETATVASVQIGETATASAAQVALQETQAPIIAAATVAAAQDAAKVQATEIVDAAHRGETLATQATATAQADAAQAQANAEAQRSSYAAWQQRYIAAAHYVAYCPQASEVASDTTSISEAVATAQASDTGYHNCSVTEAPTPRLPLTSASQPTPAQPTPSASLQAAIARVDQEGYDVVDKRDYDDPFALHVLIGVKVPTADGYTQRAFFFWQDRYIGTDAANPSATIGLEWRNADIVALGYSLYRKDDPMCCPTGGAATVRFHWDGSKLAPLDPIPSDDLQATLSRR